MAPWWLYGGYVFPVVVKPGNLLYGGYVFPVVVKPGNLTCYGKFDPPPKKSQKKQNNRDLKQGILHLWSKFGDPSLNR